MEVPELIATAKTDPDERRRAAAVEQLRDSDLRAYPDITGVLIDLMLNDAKPSVRLEAVPARRVRPVSQLIGQAMQQVAINDDNWRVRFQARTRHADDGLPRRAKARTPRPTQGDDVRGAALGQPPTTVATPESDVPPPPMPFMPAQGMPAKGPGPRRFRSPANPPIDIVPDSNSRQPPSGMAVSVPRPLPSTPPAPVPLPAAGPGSMPPLTPTNPPIEVVPDASPRQGTPGMTVSMPRPLSAQPPAFSTAMPQRPPIQVTGPQDRWIFRRPLLADVPASRLIVSCSPGSSERNAQSNRHFGSDFAVSVPTSR